MQHLGQKVWLIQHALIDNFLWVGLLLCLVLSPDAGGLRTRLRDLEGVYVLKLYQEDPSLFGASLTLTLTLWCLPNPNPNPLVPPASAENKHSH